MQFKPGDIIGRKASYNCEIIAHIRNTTYKVFILKKVKEECYLDVNLHLGIRDPWMLITSDFAPNYIGLRSEFKRRI